MINLKQIRVAQKLTQKDISIYLNKSITTICDWESGRTEPSIEDLIRLSKILNVSIDYLLGVADDLGNIINNNLSETENYVVGKMRLLNSEKKQELVNYVNYLVAKDKK